ncbi:DUF6789 family protein [Schlesneria sp. T3-172]|uniref:DUF6789 family protein n=1 Tax=Schlesneria sphaerica TaxID=3373610 RepID=UPI0037C6F855
MKADSCLTTSLLEGAVSGLIATAPMTGVMVACKQILPPQDQYPLPPQEIVEDVAQGAQVREVLETDLKQPTVWTAHYGYGSLMGLLYGAVTHGDRTRSIPRGMAYGMAVWAANYLAALPAANSKASAPQESLARNAMMIVSHLAWGAALDYCYSYSSTQQDQTGTRQHGENEAVLV